MATHLIFRRELSVAFFMLGQLMDLVLNKALKQLYFKEVRPSGTFRTDYGMPSNHSQFMFFFAGYFLLLLLFRLRLKRHAFLWKSMIAGILLTAATTVAYARVHFGHHTERQVIYGGWIGLLSAGLWFALTEVLMRGAGLHAWMEAWPLCRYFCIKDSSAVEDALWLEYQANRWARGLPVDPSVRSSFPPSRRH
ncbi:Dolichyldiphosphatase 1 [Balamuthia mandrillaris]